MKKLWLVVAAVALAGMTVSSFADVQNIRLSGDIRTRGYYLNNTSIADTLTGDKNESDDSFISQRTRVTVEADLEDHVLVVATLRAEGLWGSYNESLEQSSGAGALVGPFKVNRGWDVGVSEAYVQLNEVFYTAATLKLGRQNLHYGRGLIISSVDEEYNFDAARMVWDFYPFILDMVYAKSVESSSFSSGDIGPGTLTGGETHDVDMFFVNARMEMTDSFIKNIEGYFGFVDNNLNLGTIGGFPITTAPWVPPTAGGASPGVIGVRTDLNLTEAFSMWAEGTYEFGADGQLFDESIQAWLGNIGGKITLGDSDWAPALNFGYTYASGGGSDESRYFRPWFDYVDGYNGYLFHPLLSNIQIFNVGLSIKPYENTTLAFQAYYYMKASKGGLVASNPNQDFGITGAVSTDDGGREVGWELDTILGYDYSKDVRCQLVYAVFVPDNGVHNDTGFDAVAMEVRGEINVKF